MLEISVRMGSNEMTTEKDARFFSLDLTVSESVFYNAVWLHKIVLFCELKAHHIEIEGLRVMEFIDPLLFYVLYNFICLELLAP